MADSTNVLCPENLFSRKSQFNIMWTRNTCVFDIGTYYDYYWQNHDIFQWFKQNSTHLLIHLSAHLCYHHHSHHPSLLHSFTPGSKPTFSTNPSHLRLLLPTGLPSWQREWTGPIMLIVLFLVSHFNFFFVPCGGLSWLPVSFLLHVKYTLSYRIHR